jgi:hypothetical protein
MVWVRAPRVAAVGGPSAASPFDRWQDWAARLMPEASVSPVEATIVNESVVIGETAEAEPGVPSGRLRLSS